MSISPPNSDIYSLSRSRQPGPSSKKQPIIDVLIPEFSRSVDSRAGETDPLLGVPRVKKPFYRARPLWIVPFAIIAALVRGMTLAPRVEVFTQLACSQVYHNAPFNHTDYISNSIVPFPSLPIINTFIPVHMSDDDPSDDDPRHIPSSQCVSNPAVQAGAARLQATMMITMGLLSALSTGYWGGFGERHGRTRVLALATLGLFLTDLTFILVSTPNSPISGHGHKFLIVAPIIEGLLGGWSTLQSATFAYVSDCTSSGSRARIFSRFTGVFYLGFAAGPFLGAWMIRSGFGTPVGQPQSVSSVFWAAIMGSFCNLMLVLFVFPESLPKENQAIAVKEHEARRVESSLPGITRKFLAPLAIFLPVSVTDSTGIKTHRDWSLTCLGCAFFLYYLSTGIYQLKYLYAEHIYSWGAEKLSYYISFMGGSRALYLLVLLPAFIMNFKPKPEGKGAKPKLTLSHLGSEIHFDLILTRLAFCIDILANVLVILFPIPAYKAHVFNTNTNVQSSAESQVLFYMASSLTCVGAGIVPAVQSLALCIIQARKFSNGEIETEDEAGAPSDAKGSNGGVGQLFGALAVMHAVAQMVLGPLVFGLIYSSTVAYYPKAIFVVAGAILTTGLVCLFLVVNPVSRSVRKMKGKKRRTRSALDEERRGRSRANKPLFQPNVVPGSS